MGVAFPVVGEGRITSNHFNPLPHREAIQVLETPWSMAPCVWFGLCCCAGDHTPQLAMDAVPPTNRNRSQPEGLCRGCLPHTRVPLTFTACRLCMSTWSPCGVPGVGGEQGTGCHNRASCCPRAGEENGKQESEGS